MFKSKLPPEVPSSLREAAAWCFYRQLPGKEFRSPELDPSSILDLPDWSGESESIESWIEKKRNCYRRATLWINESRSKLVEAARKEAFGVDEVLTRGRLLVYAPLETVDDGASEAGSMGFFDMEDAPPWDTWFLYAGDSIFCYVPEFAIQRAQDGIDANPVGCIHWSEWSQLDRILK